MPYQLRITLNDPDLGFLLFGFDFNMIFGWVKKFHSSLQDQGKDSDWDKDIIGKGREEIAHRDGHRVFERTMEALLPDLDRRLRDVSGGAVRIESVN